MREREIGTVATLVGPEVGYERTFASGSESTASTRPPHDAPIDSKRYVIRKELARGGMGRVSIADDTILGRTVAIKELIAPRSDLAARFRRELSLTARLQHPSIVSIHDGGIWNNGELVYIMRLVSGASLDTVIARHDTVAERLALLPHAIAAVDALAYAHSQNIIHRDLKPANILVGDFGETVVIDWGLAKDLANPEVEAAAEPYRGDAIGGTVAGSVLGTPSYMPPEQAVGDAVDARADVYALGAVLYHMFAGAPPHVGRTLEEVLASVISGPPVSLAQRAPGLPPDLLAIVDKAMAQRLEDRYATAGELAVDLKRFQSGQLVAAHRYSQAQLVRRWLRKHRTAVIVASVAMLVIGLGGVASISRILRERNHSAEAQLLAEESRRDAEQLMSFMLVDLRKNLEPIGKLDLLASVASQAHDYYARRPASNSDEDQHRRLLMHQNLGDVLSAQGDNKAALAEYQRGLAIANALVEKDPKRPSSQLDASASHRLVAMGIKTQGDLPAALAELQKSLALAKPLFDAHPDDVLVQRELAKAHTDIGDVRLEQGDTARGLESFRLALSLVAELAAKHPTDRAWQRDVMIGHNRVGRALREQNELASALAEFTAARTIAEKLASDPADASAQEDLSYVYEKIGRILKAQKDLPGALVELRRAEAISRTLAARDPTNANRQRDLAIDMNIVSKVLLEQRDFAGALAGYRATLAIRERLATQDPTSATKQRDLSVNHYMVGDVLEDSGDLAGAMTEYRAALAIAEQLAVRDPTNESWRIDAKQLRETVDSCCKKQPSQ